MHSVLDVEQPLVQVQLRDIDAQLKKAEESLNWNSQGLDTYWYYQMQFLRIVLKCLKSQLTHITENIFFLTYF